MSVRNSAASAASASRTLASSASVQRFSPCRTGSAAAPERAAAVIFRPPSVQLGDDLRSEQSRENKCLPGTIANKPAGGSAEARPAPDRLTDTATGRASAILASCTALMGTAAAAAARSDRGWCEPGVRAADQITPEPPEEQRLASSAWLGSRDTCRQRYPPPGRPRLSRT